MNTDLSHTFGTMAAALPDRARIVAFGGSRDLMEYGRHGSFFNMIKQAAYGLGDDGWNLMCGAKATGVNFAAEIGADASKTKLIAVRMASQTENLVTRRHAMLTFQHPHTRKVAEDLCADAVVFGPGGLGTMDRFFEVLTLQQTGISPRRPIIAMGKEFWNKVLPPLWTTFVKHKTISTEDTKRVVITDDPDEVVAICANYRQLQRRDQHETSLLRYHDELKIRRLAQAVSEEMLAAAHTFRKIGPSVSIFGSARTKPHEKAYKDTVRLAEAVSHILGDLNEKIVGSRTVPSRASSGDLRFRFSGILSGGGPGIMQAANEGARRGHVPSVGLSIRLPHEQKSNDFVDPQFEHVFNYFFCRKYYFYLLTRVFVLGATGGLGTLDEFFEVANEIQGGSTRKGPRIYAYGTDFWQSALGPMLDTIEEFKFDKPVGSDLSRKRVRVRDMVVYSDNINEIAERVRRDMAVVSNN